MKRLFISLGLAVCSILSASPKNDLNSQNDITRRAAFRALLRRDRAAAIKAGLKHSDPVLRSRALLELFRDRREQALPQLKRLAADPDFRVRSTVLGCLGELPDSPERREVAAILRRNSKETALVGAAGAIAVPFNFRRTKLRLSERDDWDYAITTVGSIKLPEKNWKFATDPDGNGHERNFFAENFDDSRWKTIGVGNWETQGFPGYDGFAWYRISFDAPAKMECNAAELNFGGVDEEAWVWLNGVFVGQHTAGTAGWDKPFQLDVTDEVRWGKRNLLVVRVFDARLAGGIWKPVALDILR